MYVKLKKNALFDPFVLGFDSWKTVSSIKVTATSQKINEMKTNDENDNKTIKGLNDNERDASKDKTTIKHLF